MTGLDQDMMQRNLSCKNFKDSQKNMITSVISQFFVILLFLMLGVLLAVDIIKKNMRDISLSAIVPSIPVKDKLRSEAI